MIAPASAEITALLGRVRDGDVGARDMLLTDRARRRRVGLSARALEDARG